MYRSNPLSLPDIKLFVLLETVTCREKNLPMSQDCMQVRVSIATQPMHVDCARHAAQSRYVLKRKKGVVNLNISSVKTMILKFNHFLQFQFPSDPAIF
jgi:hypothetical protein